MFWLNMASLQLLYLLFDGSLNYLRHAEAFEVSDFSFFSDKIFKLPSWILHISNIYQSPYKGHYCWSPNFCPNNLIYHPDFHYKSSTNYKPDILKYAIASWCSYKMSFLNESYSKYDYVLEPMLPTNIQFTSWTWY